jgi:hypothetical protein
MPDGGEEDAAVAAIGREDGDERERQEVGELPEWDVASHGPILGPTIVSLAMLVGLGHSISADGHACLGTH